MATASSIDFPQEEIMVGRDITIDGLLVTAAGNPGQVFNFTVTGQNSIRDGGSTAISLSGTLILPATAAVGTFQNYQVYFETSGNDKFTVQNPQLHLSVPLNNPGTFNSFSLSKVCMFASYDPNQRPV